MPMIIFLCLVFLLNVYFQKYPLGWWRAILTVLVISIAGTIVFHIVAYYDLGYLDLFLPIAVPIQAVAGIVVGAFATLVKLLFSVSRP